MSSRTHMVVLVLCILVAIPLWVHASVFQLLLDTASAETRDMTYVHATQNAQVMPLLKAVLNVDPNPARGGGDIIVDDGVLVPHGDVDGKVATINTRTSQGEISVYTVREGDTLSEIAIMFDVSSKTILWANSITDPSKIRPGDTLVILPITGVRHVVKSGDTLASIAKKYSGDVDEILSYNQLADADGMHVGDTLVIPDGTIVAPQPKKSVASSKGGAGSTGTGSAGFSHPLPGATKTQGIHGYNGIDLSGVAVGTAVLSAASGDVIVAKNSGWNGGYGSYVVIRHPNGTQTLYAHLSSVSVTVGQTVGKGVVIGGMGNTGRSTGPHLHFEVRGARNPF